MKEGIPNHETVIRPEGDNAVFKSTVLLSGESAADKIVERVMDFPDIKRIVIFGEPGANKTTILLQLASELVKQDPRITPSFVFYDNALAKVKSTLEIPNLSTRFQYDLVSKVLSDEMEQTFPPDSTDSSRTIQFVELVGVSAKNRGTSSLREAAERVRNQNPMTQDTLVLGLAADSRSLKDAGKMRKAIAELESPLDVFDLLESFNIRLTDFPKDEEAARKIMGFFGRMATEDKIDIVHAEVAAQAKQASAEDDDRLFKLLRLPKLTYPIQSIEAKKAYLLNAACLQEYLQRLGLKIDMYDTGFKLSDKGLVLFSPYNPEIIKDMDLNRVLK